MLEFVPISIMHRMLIEALWCHRSHDLQSGCPRLARRGPLQHHDASNVDFAYLRMIRLVFRCHVQASIKTRCRDAADVFGECGGRVEGRSVSVRREVIMLGFFRQGSGSGFSSSCADVANSPEPLTHGR